jgi:hypothetical protein
MRLKGRPHAADSRGDFRWRTCSTDQRLLYRKRLNKV